MVSSHVDRNVDPHRAQSVREEFANALSHGLGFLLAAASLPILLEFAGRQNNPTAVAGAAIFSVTMLLLYAASTVYHALPCGPLKQWFNRLDHAAIFLFIAGSYTPFVLGPLQGPSGWALFVGVWALALVGMLLKVRGRLAHPAISTAIYVAMGWLALLAAGPLVERIAPGGLVLLLAGGAAYSVGVVFFMLGHRVPFAHFIWHLFVLAGSTCHYFAALWFAA